MLRGVAHDAALADLAPPDLELWLNQNDDAPSRFEQRDEGRQHLRRRDERDVHHDEIKPLGEILRREVSRVDALAHFDARLVSQPPVDLVVTDIHGHDAPRSALQEAIREAACGRAYVETDEVPHVELENFERGF